MSDEERLITEICQDKDWHTSELSVYRSIPHRYNNAHFANIQSVYWKMCVPMIYSHWEGFFVSTVKKVCDFVNSRNIAYTDAIDDIVVLALDEHLKTMSGQSITKDKELNFLNTFLLTYAAPVNINTALAVSANSNLNFKQFTKMLDRMGIDIDNYTDLKNKKALIEKLVTFRNKIAHGENSVAVQEGDINEFINGLMDLFDAIVLLFRDYLDNKDYLK